MPLDQLEVGQKVQLLIRLRRKLQSLVLSLEAPSAAIGAELPSSSSEVRLPFPSPTTHTHQSLIVKKGSQCSKLSVQNLHTLSLSQWRAAGLPKSISLPLRADINTQPCVYFL